MSLKYRRETGPYKLIAFDMDGTLLNSDQVITPMTLAAIHRAVNAGREVAISTGRALDEMREYLGLMPDVRWLISCSGAYVFDLKEKRCVWSRLMEPKVVLQCLDVIAPETPMINILTERSYVQRDQLNRIEAYQMEAYRNFYERIGTKKDDLEEFYRGNPFPIGKINFFHVSAESRARTRERMLAGNVEIEMADNLTGSLECTPKGLNKAVGAEALCRHLGIDMSEVIAVGDSDNDLPLLAAAGLSVAMGNANGNVKAAADVVVRDNDHDGCAEAIERFLL